MRYVSTRAAGVSASPSEAVVQGLSRDGGLFVPESVPLLAQGELEGLAALSYEERAVRAMAPFLDDFGTGELRSFANEAHSEEKFPGGAAPVVGLGSGLSVLELWHGPTCAFKDMALQILPHILTASMKKTGKKGEACILVATSGDTGKAALEGFRDVAGTRVIVFYPKDGVSAMQERQMTAQEGSNVGVCAVRGNFDDAQTGVKAIFSDEEVRGELEGRGLFMTSANSINLGRLVPQIVYYISAYCDMAARGDLKWGEALNICVPTGNFGNILAAYYAKLMGLPVGRLVCASNSNDVLADFIREGVYDRNRSFYATISPSMDILISSNLERLLFLLSGCDPEYVCACMDELKKSGKYVVNERVLSGLRETFEGGRCDDVRTKETMREFWAERSYLLDPHTAVACAVYGDYRKRTDDRRPALIAGTASPFKFCGSVLSALGDEREDGLELVRALEEKTGIPAPVPLRGIEDKAVKFGMAVKPEDMKAVLMEMV